MLAFIVVLLKAAKKDKRQVNEFRKGLYKKQKRQDWDHKAYIHDAPSAIIILCSCPMKRVTCTL